MTVDAVTTMVALFVLFILFLTGVLIVLREISRGKKRGWNGDQWTEWWDRDILPDEPGPGGLKLPETEDRLVVEAVGSKGSGA